MEDGNTAPVLEEYAADCVCYGWQAWANAIFLTRSNPDQRLVLFADGAVFGSQDLDFGFGWGPNVGLAYCLDRCNSIGVEFYGIDGWTSTGQAAGGINVLFPSGAYPVAAGVATFRYTTSLHNTEINFRHRESNAGWLTTLAGFRVIEISEEFGTDFQTGSGLQNYSIDVNNHLYGFQLGALANFRNSGSWFLDSWLKAGVFGNDANQTTTEDFTGVGGGTQFAAAGGSSVAFAGDIGVSVGRRITDRLSARLGYTALWIEGVALAPEQLEVSDIGGGVGGLDKSGGVFYQGGFVGLEYLW